MKKLEGAIILVILLVFSQSMGAEGKRQARTESHENLYNVIARSEATKQSQQGSQIMQRDCLSAVSSTPNGFVNARNDNFLMKRYTSDRTDRIAQAVLHDYRSFYSTKTIRDLSLGIGVAGVLANTSIDGEIQGWVQGSLRNEDTDELSESAKLLGEGAITIPLYGVAALVGEMTEGNGWGSTTGEWGRRSLRAVLVGAPPAIFLQNATGASRPKENDSHWRPFNDNEGVSGHSFMGAVPFIAAAKMAENPYLRYSLYLGSMLCGWSRLNDDRHYFSQAALGWWIAYLSVSCGERSEEREKDLIIRPHPLAGGIGVIAVLSF